MTTSNPSIRFVRILARLLLVLVQIVWLLPGVVCVTCIGIPFGLITYAMTGDVDLAEKRGGLVWAFWPIMLMEKIPLDE